MASFFRDPRDVFEQVGRGGIPSFNDVTRSWDDVLGPLLGGNNQGGTSAHYPGPQQVYDPQGNVVQPGPGDQQGQNPNLPPWWLAVNPQDRNRIPRYGTPTEQDLINTLMNRGDPNTLNFADIPSTLRGPLPTAPTDLPGSPQMTPYMRALLDVYAGSGVDPFSVGGASQAFNANIGGGDGQVFRTVGGANQPQPVLGYTLR